LNFSIRSLFSSSRRKYANNVIIMLIAFEFWNFFDYSQMRCIWRVWRWTNIRSSSRESSRYWHGTSVNKMQNTWELAVAEDDKRTKINMHSDHEKQSHHKMTW